MRKWADALVSVTANDAHPLSWDIAGAAHIDLLADAILAETPSKANLNDAMLRISAFVGEFLVRNAGGQWHVDDGGGRERISVLLPNGERADPMRAAAKRLREGKHHDLFLFYTHAVTGDLPPGAQVHGWTDEEKQAYLRSRTAT
jgi:hypothetical protein